MKYQIETIQDIESEIKILSQLHYEEIKDFGIPLQLDLSTYYSHEQNNSLKIFTARASTSNRLVGYASFFLFNNHHYDNQLEANQDAIFVHPEFRGVGRQFIDFIDIHLKEFGVKIVYHHVKTNLDWSPALLSHGYKHIENIFAKIL